MLKWFFRKWLDTFEREWGYNVDYMREVLDAGGFEALKPIMALQRGLRVSRRLSARRTFCRVAGRRPRR